jgi:RecB family exonuclease
VTQLSSWSFSTHQQIERCPAKARYAKIDKLPDPSGPHADRGTAAHAAFEAYVKGEGALPAAFARWRPMLDHIVETAADIRTEMEISLSRRWDLVRWKLGTIRAKLDLVYIVDDVTLGCVDYKTGRVYPEHEAQLELYAVLLFHCYPWAETVLAADWYLDQGDAVAEKTFTRQQHETVLLKKWKERAKRDLARKDWPAVRNPLCKHCNFNSRRGGPCVEGA